VTTVRFRGTLWRWAGPNAWTFVTVPDRCAPSHWLAWGRAPVSATVRGMTWRTSVWRGKDGRVLLALPRRVRGELTEGARVMVTLDIA
jgi:hypothetical protein